MSPTKRLDSLSIQENGTVWALLGSLSHLLALWASSTGFLSYPWLLSVATTGKLAQLQYHHIHEHNNNKCMCMGEDAPMKQQSLEKIQCDHV